MKYGDKVKDRTGNSVGTVIGTHDRYFVEVKWDSGGSHSVIHRDDLIQVPDIRTSPNFKIGDKVGWKSTRLTVGHVTEVFWNFAAPELLVKVNWDVSNPYGYSHCGVSGNDLIKIEDNMEESIEKLQKQLEAAQAEVEKLKTKLEEEKAPKFEKDSSYLARDASGILFLLFAHDPNVYLLVDNQMKSCTRGGGWSRNNLTVVKKLENFKFSGGAVTVY